MFGLPGGFGSRGFQDSFRCHSVSLLAAEQQRDASRLEYSDKIILPPSCLEKLAQLEIQYPMMFQIANPRAMERKLHCGVLEFIAQEGMAYLPYWMMENLRVSEGDIIQLRSVNLNKGSYVKLQPQLTDFIKISNPKVVLEQSLRNFSALTKGQTFRILYNKKKYDIGVVEVKRHGGDFAPGQPQAVCIIETDMQLDFEAPADYVEPPRPAKTPTPPSASPLSKSPVLQPMGAPVLDGDSSEEEEAAPSFTGSGFRLDGKAIKPPKAKASPAAQGGQAVGGGSGEAAATRLGVRIGPSGEVLSGAAPSGGQTLGGGAGGAAGSGMAGMKVLNASAGAPSSAEEKDDYWAKLTGGNKLR
ncbi:ubiquitin fusion degradation 1 protein [Emiliania huxleyi CCMP1516]|uniref:Ubiquitin fusion degradation protein n=4 Tax=Emiliania huxleyi TaxID=2903 RepID=A0A0D3KIR1_EMIH1|nr:ubiquitin fusion degradation 1 protein [Emiliania huxleyi CCMP1516]EOD35646.1 ubiquitin fusion degradation 1 protein [Emiliania huxleyi CCMP1516]|eukprot:XP_005788075.1 ubiquitin fusion degradation 1 protein [Emiliania huxleyi CCMP1516]